MFSHTSNKIIGPEITHPKHLKNLQEQLMKSKKGNGGYLSQIPEG